MIAGEADSSAALRNDSQKGKGNGNDRCSSNGGGKFNGNGSCKFNGNDMCDGGGCLRGGAEEQVGPRHGEEEVWGPGGEDRG
jgi:hypothetical protein